MPAAGGPVGLGQHQRHRETCGVQPLQATRANSGVPAKMTRTLPIPGLAR
jgi:hypothetical protein